MECRNSGSISAFRYSLEYLLNMLCIFFVKFSLTHFKKSSSCPFGKRTPLVYKVLTFHLTSLMFAVLRLDSIVIDSMKSCCCCWNMRLPLLFALSPEDLHMLVLTPLSVRKSIKTKAKRVLNLGLIH